MSTLISDIVEENIKQDAQHLLEKAERQRKLDRLVEALKQPKFPRAA